MSEAGPRTGRLYGAAALFLSAIAIAGLATPDAAPGQASPPPCVDPNGTVTTFRAGTLTECVIPAGVTRVKIEAWGAQGGTDKQVSGPDDHGGAGGYAMLTGNVEPGYRIFVVSGQAGGNVGAVQSAGAGGGGASVVSFFRSPPQTLSEQVAVIAGGGGGAGCDDGGVGGGVPGAPGRGVGQLGFSSSRCDGSDRAGGGGAASGLAVPPSTLRMHGGGDGLGGNGGAGSSSSSGTGYGGFGGGAGYNGVGGPGIARAGNGGGGGGGWGGGGGGRGAGGGGGGSYPASNGQPNYGNGRVAMQALSAGVGSGACTIEGTPGNDRLVGTPNPETICGLGGDDEILGDEGDDVLRGGPGNDFLRGGRGDDELKGGAGNDECRDHGRPRNQCE